MPASTRQQGSRETAHGDGRDDTRDDAPWRARLRSNPALDLAYRITVGVVGLVVVVVGLILVPLAGPGWLIVLGGVAIWATEFAWAHRLRLWGTARLREWTAWIGRQPLWVRGLIGLATFVFVAAVMLVTLGVTGVPDWVPDVVQHPLEDCLERLLPWV